MSTAKVTSQVNNCYRAILAQVNHLDSLYDSKNYVKELYEELTELAFYIMEDDSERIDKGISQLQDTIWELDGLMSATHEKTIEISCLIAEIRTHLDYLLLNYHERVR